MATSSSHPTDARRYLLKLQGKYAEAEHILARVTEVWEKAFGHNHPDVASGLNNHAMLLRKQVEISKSIFLYFYSRLNYQK